MATQQARQASQTRDERRARGKLARKMVPRSSHAGWEPPADRRDPVDVLTAQAETRVPDLVPIRYGRMLVSPFTFYRGAAAIMAEDLAGTPTTGIVTQLCGDAHLSNFGGFATPERDLVFGLNDFDETLPGPWEWDVKRLAASMVIAAPRPRAVREAGPAGGRGHGRRVPPLDARVRQAVEPRAVVPADRRVRHARPFPRGARASAASGRSTRPCRRR